jgi:hypothetical protein
MTPHDRLREHCERVVASNEEYGFGHTVEMSPDDVIALLDEIARCRDDEREACCEILANAEPNTRAEQAIERVHQQIDRVPSWLAADIAEWCRASADELSDLQAAIRLRAKAGQP